MFYAFALISHLDPSSKDILNDQNITVTVTNQIHLRDFESFELANMGTISLALTFLNIVIIFIMGVIILKVCTPSFCNADRVLNKCDI